MGGQAGSPSQGSGGSRGEARQDAEGGSQCGSEGRLPTEGTAQDAEGTRMQANVVGLRPRNGPR